MNRSHRPSPTTRVATGLVTSLLLLGNTDCAPEEPANPGNDDDVASSIPLADFGDAPDGFATGYTGPEVALIGAFPTAFTTTNAAGPGAHTLDSSGEWLGSVVTRERGVLDVDDPDLTENMTDDDRGDDGLISLTSVGGVGVEVAVSVAADAPTGSRYLNVLLDVDGSGTWGPGVEGPEWQVVNRAVDVGPGETVVEALEGLWTTGRREAWTRVLLTREPLDTEAWGEEGWDGSGAFAFGEVEDHLLRRPAYAVDADLVGIWRLQVEAALARSTSLQAAWAAERVRLEAEADALAQASVEVTTQATAAAAAGSDAAAAATAAAAAEALAASEASAASAAAADASAEAASVASGSASSGCATADAFASASASASATASASASALASALSSAVADADSEASAEASASAAAAAAVQAQASAFASARAEVEAELAVLASAEALALADAEALAVAAAEALAIADALAEALALGGAASAEADAAALALVDTATFVQTRTLALVDADVSIRAAASAASLASTEARAAWSAAAVAHQQAVSAAQAAASASASATAQAERTSDSAEVAASAASAAAETDSMAIALSTGACETEVCSTYIGAATTLQTQVDALNLELGNLDMALNQCGYDLGQTQLLLQQCMAGNPTGN